MLVFFFSLERRHRRNRPILSEINFLNLEDSFFFLILDFFFFFFASFSSVDTPYNYCHNLAPNIVYIYCCSLYLLAYTRGAKSIQWIRTIPIYIYKYKYIPNDLLLLFGITGTPWVRSIVAWLHFHVLINTYYTQIGYNCNRTVVRMRL